MGHSVVHEKILGCNVWSGQKVDSFLAAVLQRYINQVTLPFTV